MIEKMFSREKSKDAESYLDRAKKYGTMIVPGLALFLASCSGPEKPSAETIRNYFAQNPTAERLSENDLNGAHKTFETFKALAKNSDNVIDARDPAAIAYYKEALPNLKFIDEWRLVNDSTIINTNFNPSLEKINNEKKLERDTEIQYMHEIEYVFHSNGDLEIAAGNYIEGNPKNRLLYEKIDGTTGGVTSYYEDTYASDNTMRLNNEGNMITGAGYHPGSAKYFAKDMLGSLQDVVMKK